jgi:hypothetical protein
MIRSNEQYTEYQRQEKTVERHIEKDRVFPLETVVLQEFNTAHDTKIDKAIIHTGPYADEYARSFNALALVIGNDIFFRNNAFNIGSEDSRKTLAHELTHVAQYEEGRINNNSSVKELEAEADALAKQEEYTDNLYFLIELNKKICRIKYSELDKIAEKLAENIDCRIQEQRFFMDEEDYLKLILEYESMLEGRIGDGIFDAL